MRILGEDVEQRLYAREAARGWSRSGLIRAEQLAPIEAALGPLPSEAGWAVRALFFFFACTAASSLASFFGWMVSSEDTTLGILQCASAATAYYIGSRVLKAYNLYRFGVEEGLLVAALFHLCFGLVLIAGRRLEFEEYALIIGIPAAFYCSWLYARFGYLYGAFGAVAALTFVAASRLKHVEENDARVLLSALYALLLAGTAARREVPDHDRLGWQTLQALLFLMICLFLNLRLERLLVFDSVKAADGGLFYWGTFVFTGAAPAAGLAWSVSRRHRPMLIASFMGLLLCLVSVKPYLGLPRHAWDPAVLGGLLMGFSLWLKRWLEAGPSGQRAGFTAKPIIVGRGDGPDFSSLLAAATAAGAGAGAGTPAREKGFAGGGGSSGGAGAGGSF